MPTGILVCDEVIEQKVTLVTKELLGIGRKLSNSLNQPLNILLTGQNTNKAAAEETIALGADKVYMANSASFVESHPDLFVAIIEEVCHQLSPSTIVLGHNDMGRDIAPRLAARLKAMVIMDCIDLAVDSGRLLYIKPVYGGNATATWISEQNQLQIITMRPKSVSPAVSDVSRKGEIINLETKIDQTIIKGRLVETIREKSEGIKLEDAKVIVAGGSGIGGKDGFKLLEELARVLGGTIGVTRVPCDEGWMPISLEIGQTGRIVTPGLYFAIGISGAPQHMAGCAGSKSIVAINRDPQARMFEMSDFGVVGDYRQVLPPLIDAIKSLP